MFRFFTIPPRLTQQLCASITASLKKELARLLNSEISESTWFQICLPSSMAGLGLGDPLMVAPSAYVASFLLSIHNVSSLDWPVDLGHGSEGFWKALAAVQFESPALKLQIETWSKEGLMDIDAKYTKQAWWHTHTAQLCLRQLKSSSMVRDQLRLANQTGKFAGSWLSIAPNKTLNTLLPSVDYSNLLRWWLGLPIPGLVTGKPCCYCSDPLDIFGDHAVSCNTSFLYARHRAVISCLEPLCDLMGL